MNDTVQRLFRLATVNEDFLAWIQESEHPAARHVRLMALCLINWPYTDGPSEMLREAVEEAAAAMKVTL